MDKIHMVQEVVLVVQNLLDEIANIGERIKKYFDHLIFMLNILLFFIHSLFFIGLQSI